MELDIVLLQVYNDWTVRNIPFPSLPSGYSLNLASCASHTQNHIQKHYICQLYFIIHHMVPYCVLHVLPDHDRCRIHSSLLHTSAVPQGPSARYDAGLDVLHVNLIP